MKYLITLVVLILSIYGLFYERKQFFQRSTIEVNATIISHMISPGSRKTKGNFILVFVTDDGKRFSKPVDPVLYSYPDGMRLVVKASVYDFGQEISRTLFWITLVGAFSSGILLLTFIFAGATENWI